MSTLGLNVITNIDQGCGIFKTSSKGFETSTDTALPFLLEQPPEQSSVLLCVCGTACRGFSVD